MNVCPLPCTVRLRAGTTICGQEAQCAAVPTLPSAAADAHHTCHTQALYPAAPTDMTWVAHDGGYACYSARARSVVRAGDDIYSVNLLTGAVLLNGVPPSRLPVGMLDHPDYGPLFGGLEFDVTDDFTTRHSIRDRYYRFQLVGPRLAVFEMRTSRGEGEVLELLPGAMTSSVCRYMCKYVCPARTSFCLKTLHAC